MRGYGDGRRARVLGEPEDCTDRFGQALKRIWCGVLDGSGHEGWVTYGPGGMTLRQKGAPLPVEGEIAHCAACGGEVLWSFDDPDAGSDNPLGTWAGQDGRELCPAVAAAAGDRVHVVAR